MCSFYSLQKLNGAYKKLTYIFNTYKTAVYNNCLLADERFIYNLIYSNNIVLYKKNHPYIQLPINIDSLVSLIFWTNMFVTNLLYFTI